VPGGVCLLVLVILALSSYGSRRKRRSSTDALLAETVEPVPTARTIGAEDVLGPWRFYADAAASTVTIELSADGRYRQVILRNDGRQIECPGGTWALDGPYLELGDYRIAPGGATERVRWFFGDWQGALALFASNGADGGAVLLGSKVQ
jgi:hypothetical protein